MSLLEYEGGENPLSLPPAPTSPAPSIAPKEEENLEEENLVENQQIKGNNSGQGAIRVAGVLGRGSLRAGVVKADMKFIVVPQRLINFGCDIKFEEDPFQVTLGGLMMGDEYRQSICPINDALKECRSTNLDHALLMMGPAMLPLIPWALRSKQHKQMRRKIMQRCIANFNKTNTLGLTMRWQTRPVKELTIWRRDEAEAEANA